jgi:hypothetical protein
VGILRSGYREKGLHLTVVNARTAVAHIRRPGLTVLSFLGYSGVGYEDLAAALAAARRMLGTFDAQRTQVNLGGTAEGIGAVYRLAKALGFATSGIVSTQAIASRAAISGFVDRLVYVKDSQWGGTLPGGAGLSPTSRAMVDASDVLVAIGGGAIARDEIIAAGATGKPLAFVPAEMNHAAALERARRDGAPAPTDFRGEVHELFRFCAAAPPPMPRGEVPEHVKWPPDEN